MRNALSTLAYFRVDLLGIAFAVQTLVLAIRGKALFPSGMNAAPRFSKIEVKAAWAKYCFVAIAAAMLAGVVWDLHRKLQR